MNNKKLIIFTIVNIFLIQFNVFSQSEIDKILNDISLNNKKLKTLSEKIVSQKVEFNVGITPYDPEITFDYLFGSPKEVGNQKEFNLKFTFDFPTVYGKRNKLSELKSDQINYDLTILRQEILMKAKLTCLEIIYLTRREIVLKNRLDEAISLYEYFKKKSETGDGNIIDENKAKLQVLNFNNEYYLNKSELTKAENTLIELNGGKEIKFSSTIYPDTEEIPSLDIIKREIENIDPILKRLNLEFEINKREIEINKNLNLPKIFFGYRHQGLLNESMNGFHTGISIPLWEGNNKVKWKEKESFYILALIEDYKTENFFHIKQLYEEIYNLKNLLEENKNVIISIKNEELLEKSLKAGEISSIEYLMEISYYYTAKDKIDYFELQYYKTLVKLNRYKL